MNISRKYIIIFGTLAFLLVIITGAITYYKEKEKVAQIPIFTPIPIPEEKEYLIWCYEDGMGYDCSNREFFEPGESVAISVNLKQFDNILYDPYFLCYYTDLKGGLGKQCLSRSAPLLGGLVLEDKTIPQDKEIFTLLKLSVFPDNNFEDSEERTIMDLTGKLIK